MATLLNGIIRGFLAKMGVGAVTNWFGITNGADDGINLLQRYVTRFPRPVADPAVRPAGWRYVPPKLTLAQDSRHGPRLGRERIPQNRCQRRVLGASSRPPKAHLAALKNYTTLSRAAQDALRALPNYLKSLRRLKMLTTLLLPATTRRGIKCPLFYAAKQV